ncbi:MAG: BolA/IbaG family iron-sulfur metabolism protein [Pseudomonadota bacterium]
MTPQEITDLIKSQLETTHVEVLSDDHVHFEAVVVSPAFDGKRQVARHQMIYQTLGDHMRADIHALSIRALTPQEFETAG